MKLEEIRLLKQSDKSLVLLMREEDSEQLFVQKKLQGQHIVYEMLKSASHPNFPQIYEVAISDDTTTILEEYIEGPLLAQAKLEEKAVCAVMEELCDALQFLHEKGFIHRDVKPYNIILAKDGHIRLIDFDAVRMVKEDSAQDTRLLVSQGYSPPEQYGFTQTDERADIYSLGITFKELLGGGAQKPIFRQIISKCTHLIPEKRYRSVKDVKRAITLRYHKIIFILFLIIFISFIPSMLTKPLMDKQLQEQQETYYSDEGLLFNANNSEFIILTSSEIKEEGKYAQMQVDMTDKGDYVDFSVPHSLNNWVEYGETFDLSFYLGELADGIQPTFWQEGKEVSLWSFDIDNMFRSIPYDPFDLATADVLTQISCIDIDSDGIRELLVSKGSNGLAVITTIWKLADISNKTFEFVDYMWGTGPMYLYENGDIKAIVNGTELNHYDYSNGVISFISGLDFETFKKQQAEAESKTSQATSEQEDIITYPDEDLLFYAHHSEYIVKSVADIMNQDTANMKVDMNGHGSFVDFIIELSSDNEVSVVAANDTGIEIPLWRQSAAENLRIIPKEENISDNGYMIQITCVDIDNDDLKEVLVSKGNRKDALVTELWQYHQGEDEVFKRIGHMWGTTAMYLDGSSIDVELSALLNSNEYIYHNSMLYCIEGTDFQTFKDFQARPGFSTFQDIEKSETLSSIIFGK